MAKQQPDEVTRPARFEFRVWGKQRKARKALTRLATLETEEQFVDCYLLGDDPAWNAKVRDNTLKLKQLVSEKKGFERWTRERPLSAEAAPSPFDELFEDMKLDRPQQGKSYDLAKRVKKLDPELGVRAIFVTKNRRRYSYGTLRAEVTDIDVHESGDTLRTISFEGDDLDELKEFRKELGLRDEPNIAVHNYIEQSISGCESDDGGSE